MSHVVSTNSREDMRKLQADQDEDQAVDGEGEGVPDSPGLHADGRGEKLGTLAAEVQAASDDREDSGGAHGFGSEIGGIGRKDADDDLDGGVVDAALEPFDDQAKQIADGEAGGD